MDNKDKTPSQPIDEEEQLDQSPSEPTQDDNTSTEVDEVEDQPTDQEEVDEPEEVVEEDTQDETPPPSRRESLRIQQLLDKMKQQPNTQPTEQKTQAGLDYRQAINADDEVYKTLEEDRQNYGKTSYQEGQNEGLKQAESIKFHTRLEIDAPKVANKYKQLDTDSKEFNPALADAVNTWYLSTAGFNPQTNSVQNANVRYADFVEGIFEVANEIAGQKVQNTAKNIAKQAASTGIRPDGSKTKRLNLNQAPQDMSDEELKAALAQVMPNS